MFTNRILNLCNKITVKKLAKKRISRFERDPVISFTFDDCPTSAFQVGGKILDEYNLKGTFYVSLKLDEDHQENPKSKSKMVSELNLKYAIENGHELGCHTFDHLNAREVKLAAYEHSVELNGTAVKNFIQHTEFHSFAYPFGGVTFGSKKMLGKKFSSLRSIYPGINSGSIDLNLLRAISMYNSDNNLVLLKNWVDRCIETGGWLIFYTHDVSDKPSKYGTSTSEFREIVEYSLSSGARIVPVKEMVDHISPVGSPTMGSN